MQNCLTRKVAEIFKAFTLYIVVIDFNLNSERIFLSPILFQNVNSFKQCTYLYKK